MRKPCAWCYLIGLEIFLSDVAPFLQAHVNGKWSGPWDVIYTRPESWDWTLASPLVTAATKANSKQIFCGGSSRARKLSYSTVHIEQGWHRCESSLILGVNEFDTHCKKDE